MIWECLILTVTEQNPKPHLDLHHKDATQLDLHSKTAMQIHSKITYLALAYNANHKSTWRVGLSAVILDCFLLCLLVSGLKRTSVLRVCQGLMNPYLVYKNIQELSRGIVSCLGLFILLYSCSQPRSGKAPWQIGCSSISVGYADLRGISIPDNTWFPTHFVLRMPDPPRSPQFSKCLPCCWP